MLHSGKNILGLTKYRKPSLKACKGKGVKSSFGSWANSQRPALLTR